MERRKLTEREGYDAFSLMLKLRERGKSDPVSSYRNEDRFSKFFAAGEKICFSQFQNLRSRCYAVSTASTHFPTTP
jgi:hypothetical protein